MPKALIITYYWPPSGGVGVQRWLKFSKYFPDQNWQPIIYTPENPDFELTDTSLLEDLPPSILVLKTTINEPLTFYKKIAGKKNVSTRQGIVSEKAQTSLFEKLIIWIRGNLFIPDPKVSWVKPSVRFLKNYIQGNPVDVVITTGPPHSMHLIGMQLKRELGIKWIADFRDPWSQWDVLPRLFASKRTLRKHLELEKKVLSTCDLTLTVSPRLAETFRKHAKNVEVITNGFDDVKVDFARVMPNRFRISHVGLLNQTRNPEVLWQALTDLCYEIDGFSDDLEISFAGNTSSYVTDKLLTGTLGKNVTNHGFISHSEVFKLYQNSYVLLLLLNQTDNAKWILPGKLFEYLQTGRYMLPLGPSASDANDILKALKLDTFVDFSDYDQIKSRVTNLYMKFKANLLPKPTEEIQKYSRKQLTAELASLLIKTIA